MYCVNSTRGDADGVLYSRATWPTEGLGREDLFSNVKQVLVEIAGITVENAVQVKQKWWARFVVKQANLNRPCTK